MPQEIDCRGIASIADRLAGEDPKDWEAAETVLVQQGPTVALYLHHRAKKADHQASRERLEKARDKACADSAQHAWIIADLAEALGTPHRQGIELILSDLLPRRKLAKFFHFCFIRNQYTDFDGAEFIPREDLTTAREIYGVAAAMYERLATDTSDPKRAAESLIEANACRKKANQLKEGN